MPILQLYGFIAVPDGPLMLFTALLLWFYKKFTEDDRWSSALLMGIMIAALAYSKYHGALVVLFIVLSNLRLLKNPKFYVACLLTLALIAPHLWWQYQHDWISFRYHLDGRTRDFEYSFVTEYLLNLFAIFNPFLFPVFLKGWWKTKGHTPVLRALNCISAGFILFFLASTTRGYVQPQWEIPATFGVIAVLYLFTQGRERLRRYIVRVGWITIALIALVRIEMIFNPLGLKFEVFDNRASYNEIAAAADGRPVIFDGSYTDAAKYGFYTGRTAYAQPSIRYRTSQYELKDDDDRMAGKPAILQVWDSVPGKRRLKLSNGKRFEYIETEHFTPVRRIDVAYDALPGQVAAGDTLHLRLTLHNPYPYEYRIDATPARRTARNRGLRGTGTDASHVPGRIHDRQPARNNLVQRQNRKNKPEKISDMFLQFIKFCVVGGTGVVVDFGITFLFKEKLKLNKYIANSLGFMAAASTNYLLKRWWTFRSHDPEVAQQYVQFVGISAIGLILNNIIIYLLNDKARLNFYLSKLIAIGLVTLWNFFMNYYFTFTGK